MKVVQIRWSEERPPGKKCMYTHVVGYTPLGQCVISWKGWKEQPDFEVESGPCGPFSTIHISLEKAKSEAQSRLESLVNCCIE